MRLLGALVLVAAVLPNTAAAADTLLTAHAGLAGVVRSGRWAPVQIAVSGGNTGIDGEVQVTWGDARVIRKIALAPGATSAFVLHLRTGDPRDSMRAVLDVGGRSIATIDVPVHVAAADDELTLCAVGAAPANGPCSVTLASRDFPASYRSLDAADEVATEGVPLPAEVMRAVQLWSNLRRLERDGTSAPALGAVPAAPVPLSSRSLWLAYLALLAAILVARPRLSPSALCGAVAGVIAGGVSLAAWTGATDAIRIRHASLIETFAGEPGGIVESRADISFPADTSRALTVTNPDATVTRRDEGGPEYVEANGAVVAVRHAGLAGRYPVRIDALAETGPLAATTAAGVTVTNVSGRTLTNCVFPPEFAGHRTVLEPGQRVVASGSLATSDPVVVCTDTALPLQFFHPDHAVSVEGSTIVVLHLPPAVRDDSR